MTKPKNPEAIQTSEKLQKKEPQPEEEKPASNLKQEETPTEKPILNPERKKDSSTDSSTSEPEVLSFELNENLAPIIVEQPKEDKQEKFKEEPKLRNQDKAMVEILDQTMVSVLNMTYLKDGYEVTRDEFKGTNWSKEVLKTINHYFPDWSFDHPAMGLLMATASVGILINSKKPFADEIMRMKNENTSETVDQRTSGGETEVDVQRPGDPGQPPVNA